MIGASLDIDERLDHNIARNKTGVLVWVKSNEKGIPLYFAMPLPLAVCFSSTSHQT